MSNANIANERIAFIKQWLGHYDLKEGDPQGLHALMIAELKEWQSLDFSIYDDGMLLQVSKELEEAYTYAGRIISDESKATQAGIKKAITIVDRIIQLYAPTKARDFDNIVDYARSDRFQVTNDDAATLVNIKDAILDVVDEYDRATDLPRGVDVEPQYLRGIESVLSVLVEVADDYVASAIGEYEVIRKVADIALTHSRKDEGSDHYHDGLASATCAAISALAPPTKAKPASPLAR